MWRRINWWLVFGTPLGGLVGGIAGRESVAILTTSHASECSRREALRNLCTQGETTYYTIKPDMDSMVLIGTVVGVAVGLYATAKIQKAIRESRA